jgi:hypothetical protein
VDDLDIRQSDVLMWLPLIRFSRMLGARAEFLDQMMIVDSAQPTMVIAYTPERLDS